MFNANIKNLVYQNNNKILTNFQLNAIEIILNAFKNGHLKVSANLLTGIGKSLIVAEILKTLFENKVVNRVVFLSGRKIIQQERIYFYENNYPDLLISEDFETFSSGILMKTISFIDDEFNPNNFDLIIIDDFCQATVKSRYLEKILDSKVALLSLNNGFGETYFSSSSKVFNLKFDKYQQYIEFSEDMFVQDFVKPLFTKLGFDNLSYQKRYKLNDHILRPDFVALDKNGNVELLCEVKYYRDRVLSQGLYNTIVYKFRKYKSVVNAKLNILLLLSNIDKNSKTELFESFGIIIWDLSNLLYLTQGDSDLYKRLLTMVNYPINDINPEKPFKYEEVCKKEKDFP